MSAPIGGEGLARDELDSLLELAVTLAEEAGALALATRSSAGRGGLLARADRKSSRTDLATEADRAAERHIREGIAAARPDDAVLGEEEGASEGRSGLTWVVDPIDGTTNFVYGFPAWSVSIAVASAAQTVVGVVRDPERRETFTAVVGRGALLGDLPLRIGPAALLAESLVGTGFSYSADRRAAQARLLTRVLPAVRDIRRAGSAALDLCWIAAGRLDGFYEAGLMPWDRAAGLLVAEEAGAAWTEVAGVVAELPTLVVAAPERLEELAALVDGPAPADG